MKKSRTDHANFSKFAQFQSLNPLFRVSPSVEEGELGIFFSKKCWFFDFHADFDHFALNISQPVNSIWKILLSRKKIYIHPSFHILFTQTSDDYAMNMNLLPTLKMIHLRKIYQIIENQNSQINHISFIHH